MSFMVCLLLIGLVVGLVAVASNPSPYFAALGLVVVAGMGCGILVSYGGPFLSLVLFLIYLGGMLVVFAYSAALAAEPYPEGWLSGPVAAYTVVYLVAVVLASVPFWGGWFEASWVPVDESGEFFVFRGDVSGIGLMYSLGGGMLVFSAWMLLLTLFVVLELTRGVGRGTVRAV
uniref:NADH-ubiquinone oxidoreductase chain 6 n=1 Tax=Halichoeres hartzfeldii TaxID=241292 RepID=A0A343CWD4_9LABR|nr:NADH dehydrogenase subunit 6 [Halichoeres hartzfeldii]ARN59070.1 NADH dehydrogenase subunit 6 [Halichoeres hartzfeldii]